jgi:hypothetical protein
MRICMPKGLVTLFPRDLAEELRKVPKATRPHRPGDKKFPSEGNSKSGREATGIKHSTRSRLGRGD